MLREKIGKLTFEMTIVHTTKPAEHNGHMLQMVFVFLLKEVILLFSHEMQVFIYKHYFE